MTDFWTPLELGQRCYSASACVDNFILFPPLSTPQWAIFQGPHHRTLCRAVTAVLSLRPVGGDLPFLLKDSAFAGVSNVSNPENIALRSFLKTLVRMMSAQMSTMFLSGARGRVQVISVCFCLLLSCILLWNTDCSISLQKFARALWR